MEEHKRYNKYRLIYKAYVNELRKMIFGPWPIYVKDAAGSALMVFNPTDPFHGEQFGDTII